MSVRWYSNVMYEKLMHLGIVIDDYSKDVLIDNEPVRLQRLQYLLLSYFMRNKHKVISHDELRANVWRRNVSEKGIIVTISKLKNLIRPYDKNIKTYYGFGYKFE